MKSKAFRIFIHILYLLVLGQVALCQEGLVPTSDEESAARQLRIYRETLQHGSSDDIRVDAAVGILLQNTAGSRNILLTALRSDDNLSVQGAVCKALIKSRGLSQKIDSIEVFQEPLVQILKNQSNDQASLAAEALLLFDFRDIIESLQEIVGDEELSSKQRSNAIYALQLRPEPAALQQLIELLDDPDAEVSKAAETALQEAFGIPVGTSRKVWSDILIELKLKSPEEIRKERLLLQEMKLRNVQTERNRWQQLYLSSLDKQYELLDEAGRGKVILEKMDSDLYPIRLWALDKAAKFPVVADDLRERLLLLLSDTSRDVRLQAAKVFSNMSVLNPAETLLERFEQEKDAEVRLAMFESLGKAVFFAFLPDTHIQLPVEVKIQTLSIAADYLDSESQEAVIIGADVIRKIIELNNLDGNVAMSHLELLHGRYMKSLLEGGDIRADLLGILARLCGQGGAKEDARALYEPLFTEALKVEDDPALRLAAAQGLTYVDKVKALKMFKEYNLMQDESLAVRQVVVDLAGQTGNASDLGWLVGLLSDSGQRGPAWMAIRSLCQRQEPKFLMDWLEALESAAGTKEEYTREILDIAEQKAGGKKDAAQLAAIQGRTILWFWGRKAWDDGAAYLEKIGFTDKSASFPEDVNVAALATYLGSSGRQGIPQLIENKILMGDFDAEQPGWKLVDQYFKSPDVSNEEKQELFEILDLIKPEDRPGWVEFLGMIRDQFDLADPNAAPEPDSESV